MLVERFALLEQAEQVGFSAAVLSSYNVYFPFFEEVLLRRLHASGCSHVVLFCDARMCAEAFASEVTRPRLAGRGYVLVPVEQPLPFHPKLFLQLGKSRGSLCVGSHNLSLAGFGHNDELTNVIGFRAENKASPPAAFRDAVAFLRQYLPALPAVHEAFDRASQAAPWLRSPATVDERLMFVGTRRGGPPLWGQVSGKLPRNARRVLVLGPFFDERFELVKALREHFDRAELIVALDPHMSLANRAAVTELRGVRFVNPSLLPPGRTGKKTTSLEAPRHVHAKLIWVETEGEEVLVSGSANPSAPAFLGRDAAANAEAVIFRRAVGLSEALGLEALWNAPELSETDWEQIAARRARQAALASAAQPHQVLLAEPSGTGFLVNARLDLTCQVDLLDGNGTPAGTGDVVEVGAPARIKAAPGAADLTESLEFNSPTWRATAIVHRPDAMRDGGKSETRAKLQQALGTIYDDPERLVPLVELAYKTLFQSEIQLRPVGEAGLASGASSSSEVSSRLGEGRAVVSLAFPSQPHRGTRRKRSVAQGDVLAFIETVSSFLEQGSARPTTGSESRVAEEEEVDEPSGAPRSANAAPDAVALARTCRAKVRQLCARMNEQLVARREGVEQPHRRLVALLRPVMCVLRLLDVVEREPIWRYQELQLIDRKAAQELFEQVTWQASRASAPLFARALEENLGEDFDERSGVLADLGWLAWYLGVDIRKASANHGHQGVLEQRWPLLQRMAWLAPCLGDDVAAIVAWRDALRRSARRGEDAEDWFERMAGWVEGLYLATSFPESLAPLQRPARPGDLVFYDRRPLLVLDVVDGQKVRFLDPENPEKLKLFQLASVRIALVPEPAIDGHKLVSSTPSPGAPAS